MNLVIYLFVFYIVLYFAIFMRVSALNGSYLNSYSVAFASAMMIRLIPFVLGLKDSNYELSDLYLFESILFISLLAGYFGYEVGFKLKVENLNIPTQRYAQNRYSNYLVECIIVMIIAFVLLGHFGVGIKTWLYNNRTAYIIGRNGNGVWYILYQLNIILAAILILCISKNRRSKSFYLWYAIPVIAAYFTGSKGFLLGILILFLFFYDCFEKKLEIGTIAVAGIAGLMLIILLLSVQSGISLRAYSDYYAQFMRFLHYVKNGYWEFAGGRIRFEDEFWKLVPRSLYPDKPYVYGQIRIVNLFFDYNSIAAGNTPSFSEFIVPYADFGRMGVLISFFFRGLMQGFIERLFRNNVASYGANFNIMLIYTMLYIVTPVNFSLLYLTVLVVLLLIAQKIPIRFFANMASAFQSVTPDK